MKLDERELEVLFSKVKLCVKHAGAEEQRIILWGLLKETLYHDWRGVQWFYTELTRFVEDEFGREVIK